MVLVSVAGVLAIGWSVWRNATAAASPRLGLTLLVNRGTRVEIVAGTPLVFELSLVGSPSGTAFDVGNRWRPWHTLARIESAGPGTLPWALDKAGQRSLHVARQGVGRQEVTVGSENIARLDAGRHVHTVTWSAGPEATSRIPPGTYSVRGALETPLWIAWGWRGRALSAPTTIVVRAAAAGAPNALSAQRLARTADYYVARGDFARAHTAATELVNLEPKAATTYILLGDALAGLHRRKEALESYQRAMSLLPRSYEEPTLLYRRINRVMDDLRTK